VEWDPEEGVRGRVDKGVRLLSEEGKPFRRFKSYRTRPDLCGGGVGRVKTFGCVAEWTKAAALKAAG
jgi:hypothetical protein